MLDVHPPHGRVSGIGDFFLHLFTITVGLFIALALEGAVERYQKSEVRREAESNLRQEMRDNRKSLATGEAAMEEEKKSLIGSLAFLQAKEEGRPYDIKNIALGFSLTSLSDASWRTATATGALSLMEYSHAQRYAGVYQLQEEVMRLQHSALDDFLTLQAMSYHFDPARVTVADAKSDESFVKNALVHLVATQQIGSGLAQSYDNVLKGDAPKK